MTPDRAIPTRVTIFVIINDITPYNNDEIHATDEVNT